MHTYKQHDTGHVFRSMPTNNKIDRKTAADFNDAGQEFVTIFCMSTLRLSWGEAQHKVKVDLHTNIRVRT